MTIFRDDFTNGLNPAEWGTWGQPRPYVDANGRLQIPFDPVLTNGTAGATWQHPFTYGTFTMKMRRTIGNFKICPLLWPDAPVWPPEVDIAEGPDHLNPTQTVHYGTRLENFMHHAKYTLPDPGLSGFHILKTVWAPDNVDFYVDGDLKSSIASQDDPDIPMKPHLQVGHSNLTPEQPGRMVVEWVTLEPA